MEQFEALPEGCISEIISRTSLRDACRASSISWGFKSAVDSDAVWERFLPSDYPAILSRSVSPVTYSTKKQLYFRLSDSPVLLDGGKMSFSLDKESGKKCYMLSARKLEIVWADHPQYWEWISLPESRFSEVASLRSVCWLDIHGKVRTEMLSPKTTYVAYLVFKLADGFYGLNSAKTVIKFFNERQDAWSTVHFDSRTTRARGQRPREREDGWKEIKMGEFFNDLGDDGEVEAQLLEVEVLKLKDGIMVEGIEFRPI